MLTPKTKLCYYKSLLRIVMNFKTQHLLSLLAFLNVSCLIQEDKVNHTVDTLYTPSTGKYFKQKSTDITENFMRKLSL